MIPSIKTLERAFPGCGRELRTLLTSEKAVRAHPAAIALVAQCYHPPSLAQLRMTALNAVAGTFGVEAVWRTGEGPSACTDMPAFEYLNTGDTHTPTIIRWHTYQYRVSDIGSIIENGNYA